MRTEKEPVNHGDELLVTKTFDSAKEGSSTAPAGKVTCGRKPHLGPPYHHALSRRTVYNIGRFRVYLTIICLIPEKPENYLSLSRREAKAIIRELSDEVKLLKKQPW